MHVFNKMTKTYDNYTVPELKEKAKHKNLSGYSKMRKAELIIALRNVQAPRSKRQIGGGSSSKEGTCVNSGGQCFIFNTHGQMVDNHAGKRCIKNKDGTKCVLD